MVIGRLYLRLNKKKITAIVLLGMAVGGFGVWKNNLQKERAIDLPINQKVDKSSGVGVDTSNWQKYRNEEFGFTIRYPKNWGIKYLKDDNSVVTLGEKNNDKGAYVSVHFNDWFDIAKDNFTSGGEKTIETKQIIIGKRSAIIVNEKIGNVPTDYESFQNGCEKFAITISPAPKNWGKFNVIEAYAPCESQSRLILKNILDNVIFLK